MSGLVAVAAAPRPSVFAHLPRRVVRHLVFAGGLGAGSRVIVGGDRSGEFAALFDRLGMNAATAGFARLTAATCDAAFWFDLTPAPPGERSLFSAAALGRTAGLLAAVRPSGRFALVTRVGDPDGGHEPGCLEQHVAAFPGTATLATFPDRTVGNLSRAVVGGARPAYAVLSWRSPAESLDPSLWRRRATAAACGLDVPCCRWAAAAGRHRAA